MINTRKTSKAYDLEKEKKMLLKSNYKECKKNSVKSNKNRKKEVGENIYIPPGTTQCKLQL